MTNRVDRLEERELVERTATGDRRKVIVRLTRKGLDLVDSVAPSHLDTEREILSVLSPRQQSELVHLLRTTLLGLGDEQIAG
jgi:DNA-binding MarR family transcriptional regulator